MRASDLEFEGSDGMEYGMKRTYNRAGWIYTIFFLVSLAVQFIAASLLRKMGIVTEENSLFFSTILNGVSMYGIAFFICRAMFLRIPVCQGGVQQERWGLGKCLLYFLICLSFMYIGNMIGNALMMFTGIMTGRGMPSNHLTEIVMESSVWLNLLVMVVLAPVVEEWMFRNFLLDRIAGFGQLGAAFLSAFLFALAHGNFYQFFYAFGLGFLFAYLYMKTGKIKYCIVFHMGINFMGSVVAPELVKWQIASEKKGVMMQLIATMCVGTYGLLLLGCVVAGIVLLICNRKQISFLSGQEKQKKGDDWKAMILSPGIWVYVSICVILFVQSVFI